MEGNRCWGESTSISRGRRQSVALVLTAKLKKRAQEPLEEALDDGEPPFEFSQDQDTFIGGEHPTVKAGSDPTKTGPFGFDFFLVYSLS